MLETLIVLFEKFFSAISKLFPQEFMLGNLDKLAKLDPDRIYVENVRSILDVSHLAAVRLCEAAVRQGVFLKFVEVACPDGAVAASAPSEDALPETVRCYVETDGFIEQVELPTARLQKTVFYRLADGHDASEPQSQTA
jgi:hypothetical protein